MRFEKLTLVLVTILFLMNLTACDSSSNSNQTNGNTNAAVVTESGPKKALKAFYEAMRGTNEEEINRTLSKNSIAKMNFVQREMKQDHFNIYFYRLTFEREGIMGKDGKELNVTAEKVESDKAVLELANPETGQTSKAKFVLENGEWKLDILTS